MTKNFNAQAFLCNPLLAGPLRNYQDDSQTFDTQWLLYRFMNRITIYKCSFGRFVIVLNMLVLNLYPI